MLDFLLFFVLEAMFYLYLTKESVKRYQLLINRWLRLYWFSNPARAITLKEWNWALRKLNDVRQKGFKIKVFVNCIWVQGTNAGSFCQFLREKVFGFRDIHGNMKVLFPVHVYFI
jgi:hypothetical protein